MWIHCFVVKLMLLSIASGFLCRSSAGCKRIPSSFAFRGHHAVASSASSDSPISFGTYKHSERWNVEYGTKNANNKERCEAMIVPFHKPADVKDKDGIKASLKSSIPADVKEDVKQVVSQLIDEGIFKGEGTIISRVSISNGPKYVSLVGLGSVPKAGNKRGDVESGSKIGSAIVKLVNECRIGHVEVVIPKGLSKAALGHVVLGLEEAAYKDIRFKKELPASETDKFPGDSKVRVDLVGVEESAASELQEIVKQSSSIASGVHFARDLVGAPANVKTPIVIAHEAASIAEKYGLECTVLGAEECTKLGMGGYLGVQQGSKFPPQFIHLKYTPPKSSEEPLKVALVGKGLTFDSGGYNLKVGASQIELMKFDMGGCAAVLGSAVAIGQLKPKNVEVHWITAVCENMINEEAVRPGDILRSSNGKTIEVLNTDAEGRLTLADALVYAEKQGVQVIVDLATLTGAVVVGLGEGVAGLYANDDSLRDSLVEAAGRANEQIWSMPLVDSYRSQIKSNLADLKNIGAGKGGGSITAALFLQEFVDKAKWAHIDMAGPVWDTAAGKPTGYGVKLLVDYLINAKK